MKDSKGHGSNARGGGTIGNNNPEGKFNFAPPRDAADANQVKRNAFTAKYGNTGGSMASRDAAAASALSQGAPPPKAGPAPVHGASGGDSFFGRLNDRQLAAQNKEANDFQRSRSSGPHYLDPKDPRGPLVRLGVGRSPATNPRFVGKGK